MNSISSKICIKFKDARRALGLTQTALAQEIGCHQAALSMFEKGNPTKLSEEYVNRLSARLGLDIKALSEELETPPQTVTLEASQQPDFITTGFAYSFV